MNKSINELKKDRLYKPVFFYEKITSLNAYPNY